MKFEYVGNGGIRMYFCRFKGKHGPGLFADCRELSVAYEEHIYGCPARLYKRVSA